MNLKFMIYCRGKHASIGKLNEVQNDMGNDEDIYVDEYEMNIDNELIFNL